MLHFPQEARGAPVTCDNVKIPQNLVQQIFRDTQMMVELELVVMKLDTRRPRALGILGCLPEASKCWAVGIGCSPGHVHDRGVELRDGGRRVSGGRGGFLWSSSASPGSPMFPLSSLIISKLIPKSE